LRSFRVRILRSVIVRGIINAGDNRYLAVKIYLLEDSILAILNDEKLIEITRLRKEFIERREDEILKNICIIYWVGA